MKTAKVSIGFVVIFLMGCIVAFCYQSFARMQDEYIYAVDTSSLLFSVNPEKGSEQSVKLNKLLLSHLNRFAVAKQYAPSFISSELEELFCVSFNPDSEGMRGFSELVSNKVQNYLNKVTGYCSYGAQI